MRPSTRVVALAAVFLPRCSAAQHLKIETSLSELETRAKQDSNDAVAQFNLALGYWSKQRYQDAAVPLKQALTIDPEFAPAYFALAFVPVATGEAWQEHVVVSPGLVRYYYWTAVDTVWRTFDRLYRRAFMIDPLVDMRIAVSIQWRGGFQDRFQLARNQYLDGKLEQAMEKLGEIARDAGGHSEREPHLEEALWLHALAATRLAKYDVAIGDLQRLIDISQKREAGDTLIHRSLRTNEYRYVLAYVHERANNPNEAIRLYREALENDFGLYTAHVRLAGIYEGHGMWDQAVAERRRAVDASPDDAALALELGTTLAKAGRWDEAEGTLRGAMEANARDARAPYYLGIVEQQLNKKDDARVAFTRFLAIAPSRFERQIADAKRRLAALQ